jgi:hypothetical protein
MNNESIHMWNYCCHCKAWPIKGNRFHCEVCAEGPDNDLCEACYEAYTQGRVIHHIAVDNNGENDDGNHSFILKTGVSESIYAKWIKKHGATQSAIEPSIQAKRFVVRPVFTAGKMCAIGAYAFAVRSPERPNNPILLTALHVMDQIIKSAGIDCKENNKNSPGDKLAMLINDIQIYNPFVKNWMVAPLGEAGPMIVLPEARLCEEEPYSYRDIAAFKLNGKETCGNCMLANEMPSEGDPVWIFTGVENSWDSKLYGAIITKSDESCMVYEIKSTKGIPKHFSGSPIINKQGEVVGIAIGMGKFEGRTFGHANSVYSIRNHLVTANII